MRFLRENLFHVALIAATVILCGGLAAWGLGIAGDNDRIQNEREGLASQLKGFKSSPINEKAIEAERKQVQETNDRARRVAEKEIARNGGRYKLLVLPVWEGGKKIGDQPAFPINKKMYEERQLRYHFTVEYRKKLNELLATLKPTMAPTSDEVERAVQQEEEKLLLEDARKQRLEDRGVETTGETPPAPVAGAATTDAAAAAVTPGTKSGRGRSIGDIAGERGTQRAIVWKANEGLIYADREALDSVFTVERPDATNSELWEAQLNLWIHGDILAAIAKTARESLKDTKGNVKEPTVINSAIKRLEMVRVDRGYFLPSGKYAPAIGAAARRGKTGRGGAAGPGGMGMLGMDDDFDRGGGMPGMPGGMGMGRGRMGGGGVVANLTQRVSNDRYDVKHYSFTVVMDPSRLPQLQKNLMDLNHHTILSFEIEQDTSDAYYYYGAAGVMKVTLRCELLLLTDWERGTRETVMENGKKVTRWSKKRPAIIPVEVLQSLQDEQETPALLREEDKARVSAVAGPMGGRSAGRRGGFAGSMR